jgi:hypothetical protein
VVSGCAVLLARPPQTPAIAQPASVFDALTAPQAVLPAGCTLTPAASERREGKRVRSGLWGGLRIRSNPWIGDEVRILVDVRERMFGPARTPDGPPDARLAAQIGRSLVEGMAGYAAFYRQGDASIAVYGLRGAVPQSARQLPVETSVGGGAASVRLYVGPVSVLAIGDRGPCFESVVRHVRALAETTGTAAKGR